MSLYEFFIIAVVSLIICFCIIFYSTFRKIYDFTYRAQCLPYLFDQYKQSFEDEDFNNPDVILILKFEKFKICFGTVDEAVIEFRKYIDKTLECYDKLVPICSDEEEKMQYTEIKDSILSIFSEIIEYSTQHKN